MGVWVCMGVHMHVWVWLCVCMHACVCGGVQYQVLNEINECIAVGFRGQLFDVQC